MIFRISADPACELPFTYSMVAKANETLAAALKEAFGLQYTPVVILDAKVMLDPPAMPELSTEQIIVEAFGEGNKVIKTVVANE